MRGCACGGGREVAVLFRQMKGTLTFRVGPALWHEGLGGLLTSTCAGWFAVRVTRLGVGGSASFIANLRRQPYTPVSSPGDGGIQETLAF